MNTAEDMNHDRVRELEAMAVRLGTRNQQERFAAGLLPDDEINSLARTELFKPFADLPKWGNKMLRAEHVKHEPRCNTQGGIVTCDGRVEFETCDVAELSHDEWEVYRLVQQGRDTAANHPWLDLGSVTIEPLAHFATCSECEAEASRVSAKVTIKWAARELVREYVLR